MEWINVDDRLPETYKSVLIWTDNYTWIIGYLEDCGKWQANHTDYESGEPLIWEDCILTHWMPLPEPPNEVPPKRGQ